MSDLKGAAAAIAKKRDEILKKMGLEKAAKTAAPQAPAKAPVAPAAKASVDRGTENEKRIAEAKKRIADKSRAVGAPIVGKAAGKAKGVVNQPKNWKA